MPAEGVHRIDPRGPSSTINKVGKMNTIIGTVGIAGNRVTLPATGQSSGTVPVLEIVNGVARMPKKLKL